MAGMQVDYWTEVHSWDRCVHLSARTDHHFCGTFSQPTENALNGGASD